MQLSIERLTLVRLIHEGRLTEEQAVEAYTDLCRGEPPANPTAQKELSRPRTALRDELVKFERRNRLTVYCGKCGRRLARQIASAAWCYWVALPGQRPEIVSDLSEAVERLRSKAHTFRCRCGANWRVRADRFNARARRFIEHDIHQLTVPDDL